MQDLHIHSPEVRALARALYPDHRNLSVKQRTTALLLIHIHDTQAGEEKDTLYTLVELAKMYRGDYAKLPANEKQAVCHNVKLFLKDLATVSSRLTGADALTIVPVPEKAWELKSENLYPPPLVRGSTGICADDLYRPGWKIYGASVTSNPDGAVPTAYTKANKAKGRGVVTTNINRENGWSAAGLLTAKICKAREIPTQRQLQESEQFLLKK